MSDTVIKVENLSKSYTIRHQNGERYTALRDVLANGAKNVASSVLRVAGSRSQLATHHTPPATEEFWALNEVSFEVKQGERVGIIGRNGAGKSTLLKILSRITEPTKGRIHIKGRVASLLEVGTGFHPELTGRENISLNGAILGMHREEIRRKFDEIVAFAEVEKFLDTPVKRYSSGMYVRLAFAVAAHLEPEILLIDEVLAVGDAQFQQKCLGKMEDVTEHEGRTVFFVSHNMGLLTSLCERSFLLESGNIVKSGPTSDVVMHYYTSKHASQSRVNYINLGTHVGDEYAILQEGFIKNSQGEYITEIDFHETIIIGMKYRILAKKNFKSVLPYPSFHIYSSSGVCAFYTSPPQLELCDMSTGEYVAECHIKGYTLNADTYFVDFGFANCDSGVQIHFYERNAISFQVTEAMHETLYQERNGYPGVIPGIVRVKCDWQIAKQ